MNDQKGKTYGELIRNQTKETQTSFANHYLS